MWKHCTGWARSHRTPRQYAPQGKSGCVSLQQQRNNELSGVVRSGLRGGHVMVPEMSLSHGQSNGLENVRSKHRAQNEQSVRVPHRAAATRPLGVLCPSAEV
jgi:hypothetical protein